MNNNKVKRADKKTLFIVTAAVIIIAAIGLYSRREQLLSFNAKKAPTAQPAYVKIEVVQKNKTIRESIVQNTAIEAVDRVNLLPRVTGRLEKLNVKAGDIVRKGEIIATLEHEQQDALIGSSEAQKASARADAERAKAEMENAKTNLDRYRRLVNEGFSTQQQYDAIDTAYTSAKAAYNAALAKERQAAAEMNRVRSSRADYIIASPLDGTVLNDYSLAPGAMISPSTPLIDIADLTRLKATLKIPESKIFAVKEGMAVFLKFDALRDKEFRGRVTRIDQYVNPSTRTSNVEIELNNQEAGMSLRPGMFGKASIIEKEERGTISLPESAFRSNERGYYLFVVQEGRARAKDVSTGIREGNTIQVTSGVEPGDKVIIFGGKNLNDGDAVLVQK